MSTELTVRPHGSPSALTQQQKDLLRRTICADASDTEFALFVAQCNRAGMDPFSRQIHAVFRWDAKAQRKVMSIQVGIDGLRLIAERTGNYQGQVGPWWCGEDGVWCDVWLSNKPPSAARVGVLRAGFTEPLYRVALWKSYMQTNSEGQPTAMWAKMGPEMLAKTAESLALRAAFPQDTCGLYTDEEMGQADNAPTAVDERDVAPTNGYARTGRGKPWSGGREHHDAPSAHETRQAAPAHDGPKTPVEIRDACKRKAAEFGYEGKLGPLASTMLGAVERLTERHCMEMIAKPDSLWAAAIEALNEEAHTQAQMQEAGLPDPSEENEPIQGVVVEEDEGTERVTMTV